MNLRKKKWILFGGYNPKKEYISSFLGALGKSLDIYIANCDNVLLLGDFNSEMNEVHMKDFCETYHLKNLITDPTCFKNTSQPTSIDLMLTNKSRSFQNSTTIETGLSDFHKMTVTALKMFFQKMVPTIIRYRNYKHFDNTLFRIDLQRAFANNSDNMMNYDHFKEIFMKQLDKHAPMKEKTVRANNAPFMNKILSKAVMKRSFLRNKYNKFPTLLNESAYKKHRNFCVKLFRKEKRNYYNNLDLNVFNDNKKFWKCMKPLFSDKSNGIKRKIILIENDDIISVDKDVAEIMNNYFIEAVENLGINKFVSEEVTNEKDSSHITDVIKKYEKHPSIVKIKQNFVVEEPFHFTRVTIEGIEKLVQELKTKKSTTDKDIPVKNLAQNRDIVFPYLYTIYEK